MRNLRNIRYEVCETAADITATCWDAGKDEILVTFGPTEGEARIELARVVKGLPSGSPSSTLQCQTIASWDAASPNPNLAVDSVVSLHHFSDSLTTCLVLEGGDIVGVREDDSVSSPNGVHIEIMGSIDAGITAARWSPDEELLALTTKADTIVFMSRSFDGVAEAAMTAEDLKASKHVSVGWGKKETQFRGKGAKALRDPTIPEKVDEGVLSPNDAGRTTISWRGDGAYVAINSIESGSRRVIRVYSREGVLDSVSEPVDGLEGSLSWRPAGNLLVGTQRFSDHVDVVFFERNGLRHGQFTLRLPGTLSEPHEEIAVEWNSDSTMLAVKYANIIQLWTMGNYHWYLKQELLTDTPCSQVVWHPEKPLRMVVTASDNLISAEYVFNIARGSVVPPHDHGAVAVIDGRSVKITPFRTANIPPPMCMFEVTTSESVVDIAFSQDNSLMAVLHHSGVDLYSWQTKGPRSLPPKLIGKMATGSWGPVRPSGPVLQVCFSGDNMIHVIHLAEFLTISKFELDLSSAKIKFLDSDEVKPGSILVSSGNGTSAYIQERSGKLSQLAGPLKGTSPVNFSMQLPWAQVVNHNGNALAVGLSRNGHLYANTRVLTKNCTSFLLTPNHIVITTSNHFLKFIHLDRVDDLEVPPDDPENDERCRSIERGARLVTAIPTNMSLILQMPRGNLETIYPRAIVVAGIRQLIDNKDYGRAFSCCRTQRVDMNILYDHKPDQFLANVGVFVDQLKDVSYIDLFLTSLREEDVTQTMYKDTRPLRPQEISASINGPSSPREKPQSSKVNIVCDAVLMKLLARKNANLQNIITAHVCKNPPALDDGLLVVAGLMQDDETLAERAVEHICYLVDVNRLYDHALGLYNLDLTLLVAQQSQRDPREYLPFVQSLHAMSELQRKFTIDDHLGHRTKALGHLQALNAFKEVRDYTTKHVLYQTALGLYRYDESHHRDLMGLYAAYLESKSKSREAGLAYESLGNFAKATACYQSAGGTCWRECLFTAQQQNPPLSSAAQSDLVSTLADALYEAKDYASAALIHLDYLSSTDAAIRCLCKGYHFADAMRLATLRNRPDLLMSAVDAGLGDALSSSTELLADCKAQLKAQVPRVLELRRKAVEDPLGFFEGERPAALADIPDDVSVATSQLSTSASLFTRYTGKGGSVGTVGTGVSRATYKNRKREEKKRARGRKGTVYEEEYLVNSVRRLVERVESSKAEIERLVFGLARRGMAERARAVEGLMGEVIEQCKTAIGEIWPEEPDRERRLDDPEGMESLDAMKNRQEPPVITEFARLSLLG